MSISQQIRALQLKKSPEQIAHDVAEGQRKQRAFRAKISDQRSGGSVMDPGFLRQLEARRASVEAGAVRVDPNLRIAQLRAEGKLPPVEEGPDRPEYAPKYSPRDALRRMLGEQPAERVGYEPTPEEVLGDDALPKPHAAPVPAETDADCPPPEEVLRGQQAGTETGPYAPGDLSPEELAEIDRLNPRSKQVARPAASGHSTQQRRRGR